MKTKSTNVVEETFFQPVPPVILNQKGRKMKQYRVGCNRTNELACFVEKKPAQNSAFLKVCFCTWDGRSYLIRGPSYIEKLLKSDKDIS